MCAADAVCPIGNLPSRPAPAPAPIWLRTARRQLSEAVADTTQNATEARHTTAFIRRYRDPPVIGLCTSLLAIGHCLEREQVCCDSGVRRRCSQGSASVSPPAARTCPAPKLGTLSPSFTARRSFARRRQKRSGNIKSGEKGGNRSNQVNGVKKEKGAEMRITNEKNYHSLAAHYAPSNGQTSTSRTHNRQPQKV